MLRNSDQRQLRGKGESGKKKTTKGKCVKKDKGAGKDKGVEEKKPKKNPQLVPKEDQQFYKEQLVLAS